MEWQQAIAALRKFKSQIPTLVGSEMVDYALDNLRSQSYLGVPTKQREPGAERNEGRRLLFDSGDGDRSIRISAANESHVDLTANEYMEAHNYGVNKSVSVRSHTRQRKGRQPSEVEAHTRQMNLPKRPFIDTDKVLDARILKTLETRFKELLK